MRRGAAVRTARGRAGEGGPRVGGTRRRMPGTSKGQRGDTCAPVPPSHGALPPSPTAVGALVSSAPRASVSPSLHRCCVLGQGLREESGTVSARQWGFISVISEGKQAEGASRAPSRPPPRGGCHSSPSWLFRARSWATCMLLPPHTTTTTEASGVRSRPSRCSRCSRPV